MKKLILIALILFTAHFIRAQEFVFPMHFEDALGNRDTVFIGYDANGSRDVILLEFGEVDISYIPFDPVFDVRITNQSDINSGESTAELFHSKKKIILPPAPFYYWPQANIDIHALHWPVKASWDPALFAEPERSGSLFTPWHSWGWWDVMMPYSNFTKVLMLENHEVVFMENYPDYWEENPIDPSLAYYVDDYGQPIATFFLVFGDSTLITVDLPEVSFANRLKPSPNPATTEAWLQLPENTVLTQAQIELYSPTGRLLYKAQPTSQFHKLELAGLPKGLYLVRLWDGKEWTITKMLKH